MLLVKIHWRFKNTLLNDKRLYNDNMSITIMLPNIQYNLECYKMSYLMNLLTFFCGELLRILILLFDYLIQFNTHRVSLTL